MTEADTMPRASRAHEAVALPQGKRKRKRIGARHSLAWARKEKVCSGSGGKLLYIQVICIVTTR